MNNVSFKALNKENNTDSSCDRRLESYSSTSLRICEGFGGKEDDGDSGCGDGYRANVVRLIAGHCIGLEIASETTI